MDRILQQIRARRSCHSCVINCPVELGHDSNWIDYRYAPGRMRMREWLTKREGTTVMARWRWWWCRRFIRFPARTVRKAKGVTEKYPTPIITAGFCNYIRRKCPARNLYAHRPAMAVYRRSRNEKSVPLFPTAILYDHFIYLRIINARSRANLKNERIMRDILASRSSIIFACSTLIMIIDILEHCQYMYKTFSHFQSIKKKKKY